MARPSFFPLKFPPGILRNGTKYQAKGRWYDCSLVRFLEGAVRAIGGWEPVSGAAAGITYVNDTFTDPDSTAMTAHTAAPLPAGGTNSYLLSTGALYTIESNRCEVDASGLGEPKCISDVAITGIENATEWRWSNVDLSNFVLGTNSSRLNFQMYRKDNVPNTANFDDEWVGFSLYGWPGSMVRWFAERKFDNGTQAFEEQVDLTGDLAPYGATVLDFGVTWLSDTQAQLWSEPGGGGVRSIIATHTFGANYRDGSHQFYGWLFRGGTGTSNIIMSFDEITVGVGGAIDGKVRNLLGWRDNASNAAKLAIGTNTNIYAFTQGVTTDISPTLTTGDEDSLATVGLYGSGLYGVFNYGEGDPAQTALVEAASWQLDNFGDFLVGCLTSDGNLWYWDGVAAQMVQMTDSPVACDAVVVTPERFIVALGAGGEVRRIEWATQEGGINVAGDWTPSASNTAGGITLPGNMAIMCGRRSKNETLIFTTQDLYAMQFIGGTLVFSIKQVGTECGIISRHAVAVVDGRAIWMGQRGFFAYDGYVRTIQSDVNDYIFSDFNRTQRAKCWALPLTDFGEVWFFYPSALSDEPDRYVIYNYIEKHWSIGNLTRTAGINRNAFEYPMMSDADSDIYDHERGTTRLGAIGDPFLESGPIEIGNGDQVVDVTQLIPDEQTSGSQVLGSLEAFLYTALYPTATEVQSGPFTLANPTSIRETARQVRVRVQELVPGDWRLGLLRLRGKLGSRR